MHIDQIKALLRTLQNPIPPEDAKLLKSEAYREKCYRCRYRQDILGEAHSSCRMVDAIVIGEKMGIDNDWFYWPINFDPIWLLYCNSFKSLINFDSAM